MKEGKDRKIRATKTRAKEKKGFAAQISKQKMFNEQGSSTKLI